MPHFYPNRYNDRSIGVDKSSVPFKDDSAEKRKQLEDKRYEEAAKKKEKDQKEENELMAKLNEESKFEINELVRKKLKENFDRHATVSQKEGGQANPVVRFSKKTLMRLFENCDLQVSDKDCEILLEVLLERELDKQKKAKKKSGAAV